MIDDQANTGVDKRLDAYFNPKAEEKQLEPTPSSEQNQEAVKATNVDSPNTQTPAEPEVDEEAEALSNSKNPERTKAYIEKLKAKLKEKETPSQPIEKVEVGESILDGLVPKQTQQLNTVPTPYVNPLQKENAIKQFIDSEGNVDVNGLNNFLGELNRRNYELQLQQETQSQKISRIEENRQLRELHAIAPEIDPIQGQKNGNFDKGLFEAMRDRLVRNMWEGKQNLEDPEYLKSVYLQVKSERTPSVDVEQIRKEAAEQAIKTQQDRNQGPFEGGSNKTQQPDYDELRKQTRSIHRVDNPALDKRLSDYFKNI